MQNTFGYRLALLVSLVAAIGLPIMVGLLVNEYSGSRAAAVVCALLAYMPFYVVFSSMQREQKDLDEYYESLL